ncbi:lysophospholipid acyltransferase family protein [Halopseudomonas salegens]|uniref:1-acyl-sn-glycerol-3-phosphate acyltransferases n=1 Tax=Halopseudomonas salegens TaxID=1434072 RepID=A0A1H2GW08_9GAMM|nr:lysophospholipid acyltransferase family protein [Halopseudomonas salegens]SDU23804.1 1-acyl-sn-glycerol-3-phosphate acyltransferases [Halopseudomonas salegens]
MTVDQLKRGVGTALSFSVFGLGGLLITLLSYPMLLIPGIERRHHYGRKLIQLAFRGFIGVMRCCGVLDYRIDNQELLNQRGHLIIANHPSLIDVIFLVANVPNADCVVNGHLARNIFTRGPIRVAGFITNTDPQQVLEAARSSLARGNSLVVFPEGTRTVPGRPLRFRRGAANIALHTRPPVTPVLISCSPTTLTKGEPWYHIPRKQVFMHFKVLPTLHDHLTDEWPCNRHGAKGLTHWLNDYFIREMEQFNHERHPEAYPGNQADDHRRAGTGRYSA